MCQSARHTNLFLLSFFLLLFACLLIPTAGFMLAPVFWNTSNTMFKKSTNLPSVEIMMGDYIEIICPIYSNTTDASVMEVYVLRWVSEEEYRGCYVKNPNSKIFQCDTPLKRNKFTLAILPNPSVPGQMTFKEDTRYYMTSTSTGRSEGLLNKEGGVCAERNMKLIFYVPKRKDATKTTTMKKLNPSQQQQQQQQQTSSLSSNKQRSTSNDKINNKINNENNNNNNIPYYDLYTNPFKSNNNNYNYNNNNYNNNNNNINKNRATTLQTKDDYIPKSQEYFQLQDNSINSNYNNKNVCVSAYRTSYTTNLLLATLSLLSLLLLLTFNVSLL